MAIHQFIAVPTSGVEAGKTNTFADAWCKESKYPRQIARIGLAGAAVVGDVSVDIYFQNRKVIEGMIPSKVGDVCPDNTELIAVVGGEICPPGVEIRVVPSGNATTNPVYCSLEIKERPDLLKYTNRRY